MSSRGAGSSAPIASSRSSEYAYEWTVRTSGSRTVRGSGRARSGSAVRLRVMSARSASAALREVVSTSTLSGSAPSAMRRVAADASSVVFPVPGPPSTRRKPPGADSTRRAPESQVNVGASAIGGRTSRAFAGPVRLPFTPRWNHVRSNGRRTGTPKRGRVR